jgi:hypothetical protein
MSVLPGLAAWLRAADPAAPPVYLGVGPDEPDELTLLTPYAGGPPQPTQEDGLAIVRHRLQVVVRGLDYPTVAARARALHDQLGRLANLELDGTRCLRVTALQPPFDLPRDSRERARLAFNLEIEEASA